MSLIDPVDAVDTPNTVLDDTVFTDTTPDGPTFASLGLPQTLVTALERRGIRSPFAIQASALPGALAGRDVLGKAATRSGKTPPLGLPPLGPPRAGVPPGPRAPRGGGPAPPPGLGPQ